MSPSDFGATFCPGRVATPGRYGLATLHNQYCLSVFQQVLTSLGPDFHYFLVPTYVFSLPMPSICSVNIVKGDWNSYNNLDAEYALRPRQPCALFRVVHAAYMQPRAVATMVLPRTYQANSAQLKVPTRKRQEICYMIAGQRLAKLQQDCPSDELCTLLIILRIHNDRGVNKVVPCARYL